MTNLTRVTAKIGGLSLLIESEDETAGHIAMINPSPDHMLPSDREFSNKHVPLLIVREKDIFTIEGQPTPFALTGSILPRFLGPKISSFDGFVGYSVQGTVMTIVDANMQDDTRPLRFNKPRIDHLLDRNGCRRITEDAAKNNDWSSLKWTADLNAIFPGLRLAPEWIDSPHVGARLTLGSGTVSGTPPAVTESGHLKVDFYETVGPRVFSDAFRYDVDLAYPTVLIDGRENRWRVVLKPSPRNPINVWILSLDDRFSPTRPSLTDHFYLYSLLPWRFRVPSFGFCDTTETEGGCINALFIQQPARVLPAPEPAPGDGTKAADTETAPVEDTPARKSTDGKKGSTRKRRRRSS